MASEAHPADALRSNIVVVAAFASDRAIYGQIAASVGRLVKVHAFADASGAVRWLSRYCANLVISDDSAFAFEGTDFVRWLAEHGRDPRVPVVVIAPHHDWPARQPFLEAGVFDVWYSPVNIAECKIRIRNLLRLTLAPSLRGARPGDSPEQCSEGETTCPVERR